MGRRSGATGLWGALNLVKAITAARMAEGDAALAAIGNAKAAAGRLGDRYHDRRFDTEFGAGEGHGSSEGGLASLLDYVVLERETGFEPATSTLARLRSTE